MDALITNIRSRWTLAAIYISTLIFSLHYSLVIYINSSFLGKYISDHSIGILYIVGSLISIPLLLNASRLLKTIGNRVIILTLIALEIAILGTFAWTPGINWWWLVVILFTLHHTIIPLILFNFDVFLEEYTSDAPTVGEKRSLYLTIINVTYVISPAIIAFTVTDGDYWKVYLFASLLLLPMFFIISIALKNFKDPDRVHTAPLHTAKFFFSKEDLVNIFASRLLLQFFYAWMVIYTPLYLHGHVGLPWSTIGIIFTIMLLPFVLFEIPVAEIADKRIGEKEFLTAGFIIAGLFTLLIPSITSTSIVIWAAVLFMTRVGASFIEVTTESYFFKQINKEDPDLISFFRLTDPISYIIAPIVATLSLYFIDYRYTFIILGTIMICGIFFSLRLRDTK